ncbi:putative Polycomb protein suz12-A, partial [Bisporella sp. PMI_857]
RQTFLVPKTAKPLYDTISKRILEPGEEVPSSDDEKDEGWLHQKHRDIVLDHSDVPDDEKDYILRWNPFIMNAQLTSENLPEAVLAFVAQNVDWFPKRKSRKWEFSTHIETFVMRGVLEQEHYTKAMEMIRRAEKAVMEKKGGDVDMVLDP